MENFKFGTKTQIVLTDNYQQAAVEIIQKENAKRISVLVDESVMGLSHIKSFLEHLSTISEVFIRPFKASEPTTDDVDLITPEFRNARPDLLLAIGGGSTLDLVKAISAMVPVSGSVTEYHGTGKPVLSSVRKIVFPTTAGTGSDVTPGAVLVNPKTAFKRALSGDAVCPDYSILDPKLIESMPPHVAAATGMDALAHTVESFTAKCANEVTRMYSLKAFSLIVNNLPLTMKDPSNLEAKKKLLLGASLAGVAIFNSNTGACHAMAYPLGIYQSIPHGVAVGLLLPKVVEINVQKGCSKYAELLDHVDGISHEGTSLEKSHRFAGFLSDYYPLTKFQGNFARFGVNASNTAFLAERGMDLVSALSNNPVEFTLDDAKKVLVSLSQ